MALSKESLTDFEVAVPEGVAAIRIDKKSVMFQNHFLIAILSIF
ncbi:MAG: hypothetical protein CM15mP104_4580 [Gammaproteobacteria bacterium]|nr:MAG: hypothetical protein CM15mP104_4580 [Gammaproteobacteria bacterium]